MATNDNIITLHQPKRAMTPAERSKAYRLRQRAKAGPAVTPSPVTPVTPAVTSRIKPVTPSRSVASTLLTVAAFGLAAVGITMNGWFAKSLGSTEIAGWCFLFIGVAADLVALAVPATAAGLWQTGRRGTALAGWALWLAVLVFVTLAGIGFASVNVTDVQTSRASRITPAVETAKAALADAVTARDRECKGGVGKFCREREAAVNERQLGLNAAMHAVEQTADPQVEAASRIVFWASMGALHPTGGDFAMLRLILLALLPQAGGILLMVAKTGAKDQNMTS